jgi:hypothetical protein
LAAALAVTSLAACGTSVPRQPPGRPPTPDSVSVTSPGGDAHDPHHAALLRQLKEPWGARNDKDDQLHGPTPDWRNWKRVRFWGFEHFTGWRYGDDHHLVGVVFVQDAEDGARETSDTCMRRFEAWARPQLRGYEVELGPVREHRTRWRDEPLAVHYLDGKVYWAFSKIEFSAAWAAYAAYPDACLIYAMAVQWRDRTDQAKRVRDRWVEEGFELMHPLTETRPYRK